MIYIHSLQECRKAFLSITSTIREAAQSLTNSSLRICLVVDQDYRLLGVVSDGDIRRGLLKGVEMNSSIASILNTKPLVAPIGMPEEVINRIMIANNIYTVPELDDKNCISALFTIGENVQFSGDLKMVIMAGGKGTRLRPYTHTCPKPMLPIKGKPMLEHIITQAKLEGINKFILSVNYLSELVEDYFRDGSKLDVEISYIRETKSLGTVGSLSLINERPTNSLIVTNCDVISDIKYTGLLEFHERQQSIATMAVRTHELQNPFGVVELDGLNIIGFAEKPVYRDYINAGVYCLSPSALDYLDYDQHCDMPLLFERVMQHNKKTYAYPMHEPWLDVGRPDDLLKLEES